MKKDRILYIDRLRGVNILLVVMGHVVTHNVIDGTSTGIWNWGGSFRMPLFMFLCGYIAGKIIKPRIFDNYPKFILKKSRTLLLPFFAWPLIVDTFFFQDHIDLDLWNRVIELLNGGGLWFLWFLFIVTILYSVWLYLSDRFNNSNKLFLDLIFFGVLFTGLLGLWYIGVSPIMKKLVSFFIFYFFGVFVAKYDFLTKTLMHPVTFSLAFLIFLVVVGNYDYTMSSPRNSVIKIICAVAGISVFYFLIRHLRFPPLIDKYIRYWGVSSLIIYVTHNYVYRIFTFPFISKELNEIPLFVFTGIVTLLVVIVSMFIYKMLSMSIIFKFLLYGENVNLTELYDKNSNQQANNSIQDIQKKEDVELSLISDKRDESKNLG